MENTHALKFANRESERVTLGIRTFPHLLYGVSEDSPDHFKQKYTLVAGKGYIYLHEHNKGLAYPSQQRNNVLGAPDD